MNHSDLLTLLRLAVDALKLAAWVRDQWRAWQDRRNTPPAPELATDAHAVKVGRGQPMPSESTRPGQP